MHYRVAYYSDSFQAWDYAGIVTMTAREPKRSDIEASLVKIGIYAPRGLDRVYLNSLGDLVIVQAERDGNYRDIVSLTPLRAPGKARKPKARRTRSKA